MAEKESFRNRLIARLKTNKNAEQDNKLGNILLRNKAGNKASENINQSKELDKGRINPRKGIDAINQTPKDNPPSDDFGGENDSPEQIDPENMDFGQDVNPAVLDKNKARTPRTAEEMERYRNAQLNKTPENIPGGESVKVSPKKTDDNAIGNLEGEKPKSRISRGIDSAKQKINQVVDKVKDKAKQLAKKMTRKAIYAGLKAFWLAFWPWILGILAVLIVLGIAGYFLFAGGPTPNPFGKSAPDQVNAIEDKEWVQKVLMLAGDTDTTNLVSETFLNKLKNDLTIIGGLILADTTISATDKQAYAVEIEDITQKIDSILSEATSINKKKLAIELKTKIQAFIDKLLIVIPLPSGTATWPLDQTLFTAEGDSKITFNNNPHLGVPGKPCGKGVNNGKDVSCNKPPNGTLPARTFMQSMAPAADNQDKPRNEELWNNPTNSCDAVDLKIKKGSVVRAKAVFSGEVTKSSGQEVRLEATIGGKKYTAVYGHLTGAKTKGTKLNKGDEIGTVGLNHLHFELAVDDKCVVLSPEATKIALREKTPVGQLVWQKIATALGLN